VTAREERKVRTYSFGASDHWHMNDVLCADLLPTRYDAYLMHHVVTAARTCAVQVGIWDTWAGKAGDGAYRDRTTGQPVWLTATAQPGAVPGAWLKVADWVVFHEPVQPGGGVKLPLPAANAAPPKLRTAVSAVPATAAQIRFRRRKALGRIFACRMVHSLVVVDDLSENVPPIVKSGRALTRIILRAVPLIVCPADGSLVG
jgi:hypothetical protein